MTSSFYLESSLIKKFLSFLDLNGSSQNTISSYKKDLIQFIQSIIIKKTNLNTNFDDISFFSSLNQDDINLFIKKLYEEKISDTSLARKISCLRSFFKFIFYKFKIIEKIPDIKLELPKIQKKLPISLSKDDINNLIILAYKKSIDADIKNNLTWALLYSMLEFLYSSGCRISEALSIKIGMIINQNNNINNEIIILGKGNHERIIFINETCANSISYFLKMRFNIENLSKLKNSSQFLFSIKEKPLSRQRIFQLIQELGIESRISKEKLSPHKIRHSIAIHLLSGNKNSENNDLHEEYVADIRLIQEFLGHKSINTTQIYLDHQNYENLKNVVNLKHPLSMKNDIDL